MTAPELRAWIDSLTQDIDFAYRGKFGSICPFHREDIALCYDGYAVDAHSCLLYTSDAAVHLRAIAQRTL